MRGRTTKVVRLGAAFLVTAIGGLQLAGSSQAPIPQEPWRDVEIIRTAHGVPHIRASNLRAGGYGLAWVMSEDYGSRTGLRLLSARGELSRFTGRQQLEIDFENLIARKRAIETYHLLEQATRDIYDYNKAHGKAMPGVGDQAYQLGATLAAKVGDVVVVVDGSNVPRPPDNARLKAIALKIIRAIP